jgi:hypothetical protein
LTRASFALCAALIGIPLVFALAVPLYQRTSPELIGIPFFFWFQMGMAVLAAAGTGTVVRLAFHQESDGGKADEV